jgi:quercetin dioxygenase-like cupin family protein
MAAQFVMIPVAFLTGKLADPWGRKPLFLVGFGVLALRGVLYTFSAGPVYLLAVQSLDGVGAAIFGVLWVIIISDLATNRSQLTLEWSLAEVEALGFLGDGSRFQAAMVRMEPGGLCGKHPRPSINDEFVLLYGGEAVLTLDDFEQTLQRGDSVTIPAGLNRRWRNDTSKEVQLIIVSVKPSL